MSSIEKNKKLSCNSSKDVSGKRHTNRQIILVSYFVTALFLGLIGYIVYFVVHDSSEVITNSYNERITIYEKKVVRGNIISSDGQILAQTVTNEDGTTSRQYPYGAMFAHAVGYTDHGKTGLESTANFYMYSSHTNVFDRIGKDLREEKQIGDNVVTTLDTRLQKIAYDALGNRRGAVVVMESKTGKIRAMVSKPDFDPGSINENWNYLTNEEDSTKATLLNRATQVLYPPGSTFKTIMTIEYIKEHPEDYQDYSYNCQGSADFQGHTMNCYGGKVHGNVNLEESLAYSCNTSFGYIGEQIDKGKLYRLCKDFLFNSELPYDGTYLQSKFLQKKNSPDSDRAQIAIGQGTTEISPLHNAMIMAAVANGGVMMKPYLIDHIENYNGNMVKKMTPKSYKQVIDEDTASIVSKYLESVVNHGTATQLQGFSGGVAGKTGSADVDGGKPAHSWFVGFSPIENPELVVSIIVENAGTGAEVAVPIANEIFKVYYNQVK